METREENLKKINAELEKLTDEELDQVAGGTCNEYWDLALLLPKVPTREYRSGDWEDCERSMYKGEVESWLSKNLGIQAKISTGWFDIGLFSEANIYYRTTSHNGVLQNEYLTHEQVLEMVKAKLGK